MVRRQAVQISAQAVQISEFMEANETLAGRLARLEHLLSRNSGNSSNPPSRDDDPGKPRTAGQAAGPGWAEAVAGQAARSAGNASGVDR